MLTIQIVTKNNAKTIRAALESVASLKPRLVVGDLGSTDDTKDVCMGLGATVVDLGDMPRDKARNRLAEDYGSGSNFWMHPWEALIQGHGVLSKWKGGVANVTVLQNHTYSQEVRLYGPDDRFVNPVFERIDCDEAPLTGAVLFSRGNIEANDAYRWIEEWKAQSPLSPTPHYYQGCMLLSEGRYDDFIKVADHYLFMDRETSMSTVMTRYYYALAQLVHKRAFKPALQNLNLCLCAKPLMAEFWCLTGDVYYHLLHRFRQAKEFYDNAIILGGRRKKDDRWPMDITKYSSYPKKMMDSCDSLLHRGGVYVPISERR